MADLRLGPAQDPMLIKQDEDLVLAHANQVLADWGREPLGRLSLLYHQVDETFLATFAELDHYGGRPAARYWGAWPNVGGKKPLWPQGRGQRVFAYVKPFRALARLLQQLCDLQYPTLVYAPGMASDLAQRFGAATMRFEAEPLDLGETGRSCDLAILNGNHGTTVAMLLAGKPTLQVPIALEQGLFSMAVARLGAAVVVPPDRPQEAVAGLMRLLGSEAPAEAARAFAARYADYDPQRQVEAILGRIEELLQ
jgi:hypothetical protein